MPTRNTQHYDVVIAGARCAGAATAMLLARQGARVLVLDRSRYGTDTLSTHALMRGAVLQLHRWGLLAPVVAAGTPAIRSTTFHLPGAVSTVEIKPRHGVGALYAPRRVVLDAILAEAARSAGAELRFGTSVTGLRRDRTGRVTGVTGRAGAAHLEVGADLVVGADGRRSTVARCVGAEAAHVAPASSAVIYRYFRDPAIAGYHWHYATGAAAGAIPTNDGLACVFAATSAQSLRRELDRGADAAFRRVLATAAPNLADRLARRSAVGRPRVFPGLTGYLRNAAGPGWALVGDAGYFKDPLTAHGITDALRDAEILARVVTSAGPDATSRYQAERDALSLRLFRVTGRIASFTWTADDIGEHLLELKDAMAEELAAMTGDYRADPGRQPAQATQIHAKRHSRSPAATSFPRDGDQVSEATGVGGQVGGRVGPPLRDEDQPGVHEVEAVEEPQDLRPRADVQVGGDAAVVDLLHGVRHRGLALAGAVAQHQVTAGRERVAQRGHDAPGISVVTDEWQHGDEQQADRPAEVDQSPGAVVGEDLLGVTQVGFDDGGAGVAGEDGLAVGDGDRVHLDVGDAGGGVGLLGGLVHVALGRDAGADVQELADAGPGQEPYRPAEELPVSQGERPGVGIHGGDGPSHVLVG
jgi:menaquinone-9 beta-reductase